MHFKRALLCFTSDLRSGLKSPERFSRRPSLPQPTASFLFLPALSSRTFPSHFEPRSVKKIYSLRRRGTVKPPPRTGGRSNPCRFPRCKLTSRGCLRRASFMSRSLPMGRRLRASQGVETHGKGNFQRVQAGPTALLWLHFLHVQATRAHSTYDCLTFGINTRWEKAERS